MDFCHALMTEIIINLIEEVVSNDASHSKSYKYRRSLTPQQRHKQLESTAEKLVFPTVINVTSIKLIP